MVSNVMGSLILIDADRWEAMYTCTWTRLPEWSWPELLTYIYYLMLTIFDDSYPCLSWVCQNSLPNDQDDCRSQLCLCRRLIRILWLCTYSRASELTESALLNLMNTPVLVPWSPRCEVQREYRRWLTTKFVPDWICMILMFTVIVLLMMMVSQLISEGIF